MENTLALDLGTNTGWALTNNGQIESGVWQLATARELRSQRKAGQARACDLRAIRLFDQVRTTVCRRAIRRIAFEDVAFAKSLAQAQLWASLRSSAWIAAHLGGVRLECVATGTLKRFATGRGNADKDAMSASLAACGPPWARECATDDEADAVWILRWAIGCPNAPINPCASRARNRCARRK